VKRAAKLGNEVLDEDVSSEVGKCWCTGFVQILEKYGKCWNSMWKFSKPWKAGKMIIGMVKSGKILENCNADLKNAVVYYTVDYPGIC